MKLPERGQSKAALDELCGRVAAAIDRELVRQELSGDHDEPEASLMVARRALAALGSSDLCYLLMVRRLIEAALSPQDSVN
jgi:hypothetical protein